MKKISNLLLCILLLSASIVSAQYGIGTDSPSSSAALDISSTTGGLLVPRMSSSDRDAISSPSNGLLIWNNSNNSFEVYKVSCSCWVGINDGGNIASSSLVNSAPTASSLNYIGSFIEGQSATIVYTYNDTQSDLEGATSIVWQRASTAAGTDAVNIKDANNSSYTFQTADLGMYVRAIVTPRAASGVLNGVLTYGSWNQVQSSSIPTANSLSVSGTPALGSMLTATYTFSGGNGTEDLTLVTTGSPLSGTSYTWQVANTNTGVGLYTASFYGAIAFTKNYYPQSDLLGKFVRVGVKAKDGAGLQATNFIFSPWIGPITSSIEVAPTAINVSYTPAPAVGLLHTSSYTFFDANNDPEGATTFQWYRADDASGNGSVAISGATTTTYTGVASDAGKYLGIGVTSKALTGITDGNEVIYYNTNPTLPKAAFTFTANSIKQFPFFHQNRTMNAQNAIEVEINVLSTGGISFSSPIVNGYNFSNNLVVSSTGIQWITLLPVGVQTVYNTSGDNITITGIGQSTETKSINIYNTPTGSSFNAFYNGITTSTGLSVNSAISTYISGETFNNNSLCQNSPISANYTTTNCTGSITLGGNSYNLVHINGQCWLQTNLKEIPSNYSSYKPTSWLATSVNDVGYWGYYNTSVVAGTSGWNTIEPTSGEGFLYQWSAAMNGAILERSKGVCPVGFHIPSDCEWLYLEHGQGMSITEQNTNNATRANVANQGSPGYKLRSGGANATNTSGFSGLLSGRRETNGTFNGRTSNASIWSSTNSGTNATIREMTIGPGLYRSTNVEKRRAMSVRCLKD